MGGEGVAYHDDEVDNLGGQYRDEGVDIQDNHVGGGYNVGWTRPGEWLVYSLDVVVPGNYLFEARVATPNDGAEFHVEFNGEDKTGSILLSRTGSGWQTWLIIQVPVSLSAGQQAMRVVMDTGDILGAVANFDWFRLTSESVQPIAAEADYTLLINGKEVLKGSEKPQFKILKIDEEIKKDFMKNEEQGLTLEQFVKVMLVHLPETKDRVGLVRNLIELFKQIDVNNDKNLEWEEFTNHIIELGK